MSNTIKDLAYYMGLHYTIEVIRDNNEDYPGWVARVVELPGCITQGDDFEELGEMIEDAMRGWIEIALEDGIPIPEPRPREEYSGKFVVRVPKSLHRELVEAAEREGVSLNAYVMASLAKAVGNTAVDNNKAAKSTGKSLQKPPGTSDSGYRRGQPVVYQPGKAE